MSDEIKTDESPRGFTYEDCDAITMGGCHAAEVTLEGFSVEQLQGD